MIDDRNQGPPVGFLNGIYKASYMGLYKFYYC